MWVDEGYSSETLPPSQSNGHNTRVQKSPGRGANERNGRSSLNLWLSSPYIIF